MDEELDSLREKSTRASSVYDDLEGEGESSGGFLGKYSPSQLFLLALLLFLDIVALACLVLVIFGFLPF
jgi:hypothetical protein